MVGHDEDVPRGLMREEGRNLVEVSDRGGVLAGTSIINRAMATKSTSLKTIQLQGFNLPLPLG
eukprot:6473885-Amphidinium_carterae.3